MKNLSLREYDNHSPKIVLSAPLPPILGGIFVGCGGTPPPPPPKGQCPLWNPHLRHCEATKGGRGNLLQPSPPDCFASLAMTSINMPLPIHLRLIPLVESPFHISWCRRQGDMTDSEKILPASLRSNSSPSSRLRSHPLNTASLIVRNIF